MIVALEEAKYKLTNMRPVLKELGDALRVAELAATAEELEKQTLEPDFWSDQENSTKVLQTIKQAKDTVADYNALVERLEDAIALAELAIEENDESCVPEVEAELEEIIAAEEKKRISILLSGEYDRNNAIISFHPGAGGTEAQDWALMLYRMITRWAEKNGFKVKLTDWLDGEEAGIKSATIMVEGLNAYGYLKSENGVHRLVRVSPFDSSGRRHTSFAFYRTAQSHPHRFQNRDNYQFGGSGSSDRRRTAFPARLHSSRLLRRKGQRYSLRGRRR